MSTELGSRWRSVLALALLTLGALGLRVHGIDHLLPHHPEMDAQIVGQTRAYCERGGWSADERGMNDYPTLIARLAALPGAPPQVGSAEHPAGLEQHLEAASAYHLRVRWLVCLFSAACVPLLVLLARSFLGPGPSFAAGLLVALDPLHLLFSAQARPHAPFATLVVLCLLSALRLRRDPSATSYALAGLAGACAMGALHSGLACLLPLAFAHFRRDRSRGAPAWRALIALALLGSGFALFYRDILLGMRAKGIQGPYEGQVAQGGHSISLSMFDGGGFELVARYLFGTNPALGALVVLAALVLGAELRGARWRAVLGGDVGVVLAFALPYLVVIGIYNGTGERFTLPLLPCYALIAAAGLERLARFAGPRFAILGSAARGRSAVLAAATSLASLLPAATSAKIAWLRARPDTQEQCAALLQSQLPEGASVMLQAGLDLPIYYSEEALYRPGTTRLRTFSPWSRYQKDLDPARREGRVLELDRLDFVRHDPLYEAPEPILARLQASPSEWLVLEVSGFFRAVPWGRNFLQAAERWGRLSTRIRPDPFDEAFDRRLHYIYCEDFLARVFSARALGPELRIYRRAKRQPLPGSAVTPVRDG